MNLDLALRQMRILWGALLTSVVVLLGVLLQARPHPHTPPEPVFIPMFGAVALMAAIMSFLLPRFAYRKAVRQLNLATTNEAAPDAFSAMYREAVPTRKLFADPGTAQRSAATLFQARLILEIALSESVALMGFMLGWLGFELLLVAPFSATGLILILLRFPTAGRILRSFEKEAGASFPDSPAQGSTIS
jgi:hypothetical protein